MTRDDFLFEIQHDRICWITICLNSQNDSPSDRMKERTEYLIPKGIVIRCAEGRRWTAAFATSIQQSKLYLDAYWFWQLVSSVPFRSTEFGHAFSSTIDVESLELMGVIYSVQKKEALTFVFEVTGGFLEPTDEPWCMKWNWMNESQNDSLNDFEKI